MKPILKSISIITTTLMLASCSNSVEVNELEKKDEMAFTLTTASSSRAWEIYSNNNKPDAIRVTAYNSATGKAYFIDKNYIKDGNIYTEEGGNRYWPQENMTLKFYSISDNNLSSKLNTNVNFHMTEANCNTQAPYIRFENYVKNAAEQEDLLYAFTEASKPTSATTRTPLNFRHAFSMVAFKASNNMGKVQIKIDEIRLGFYATKGTFKFPTKSTSGDISDSATSGEWGKSSYQTGVSPGMGDTDWWLDAYLPDDLIYTKLPNTITINPGETSDLTYTENSVPTQNPQYGYPFIVIPYYANAWTPRKGVKPWSGQVSIDDFGCYLMVKCSIQNISDDADGAIPNENDAFVWGKKNETAFLLIPWKVDHKQGKKYIYTLNFSGNGNNAYDPGTITPVAVPVNFTITVDDFTDSKNTDLEY